jgi:hypothetical protein
MIMPLMPMSAIDPRSYVLPYILLLLVCVIVFLVCIISFRSLRLYRRKRNLLVYTLFALTISLIGYQATVASVGPNYISFGIQKTQTPIYAEQQNHFSVTCYSDGGNQEAFYMLLKCTNATLQVNGQVDYVQVNGTAIKIPFSFPGGGEQTKQVYFRVNAGASNVEFYPSIERQPNSAIIVATWLSEIRCNLDPTTNSYAMADSMPIPVP